MSPDWPLRLIVTVFLALMILDYARPALILRLSPPPFLEARCRALVVDLANVADLGEIPKDVCVIHELTVDEFRLLGSSRAQLIIYIAHGFVLPAARNAPGSGDFALATSERPNPLTPLEHPLLVLRRALARGRVGDYECVAVTKNVLDLSHPFDGKIIVLVTCGAGEIDDFARALLDHGARIVVYFRGDVDEETVREILRLILESPGGSSLDELLDRLEKLGAVVLAKSAGAILS